MSSKKYDHEPTIGLLEFSSIARGIEVADQVLKQADVRVLFARPVSPGKYVLLFTGSVDAVTSSLRVGAEWGAQVLVDRLLLPAVDEAVLRALERPVVVPPLDAVGVIETFTVASTLLAADAAVKAAEVKLIEIKLARGIGGKSYVTLTGEVSDVESAVGAGGRLAEEGGRLLETVVIPRPHDELRDLLGRHDEDL
ncbi:MAG: BMC domain-containing protein [Planctomycetota bacterium]